MTLLSRMALLDSELRLQADGRCRKNEYSVK
jgi:hypothetical protein